MLLNVCVSAEQSVTRIGKNNVGMVCVPNPPFDPKKTDDNPPRSLLVRVKTSEMADELHEKLNQLANKTHSNGGGSD